jgi:hypothetical protein
VRLDAGLAEHGTDRGVVLKVPGEAIELVDHEGVYRRVLGETGEHRLELRSVGGAGRLAAVDELVRELPASIGDEPAGASRLKDALRGGGEDVEPMGT